MDSRKLFGGLYTKKIPYFLFERLGIKKIVSDGFVSTLLTTKVKLAEFNQPNSASEIQRKFGQSKASLKITKQWKIINSTQKNSSVKVTKSAGKYGFGHIYWRNLEPEMEMENFIFVQWNSQKDLTMSQYFWFKKKLWFRFSFTLTFEHAFYLNIEKQHR